MSAELFFGLGTAAASRRQNSALRRFAMAASLVVLTVGMGAGVFAIAAAVWVPSIKAAFGSRESIVHTLAVTIVTSGVNAAMKQYRSLLTTEPANSQLNALGHQFLRAKKLNEAIRFFELNVEAYPQSSRAWDSLAEAHLVEGNTLLAIAFYRKALQLNPRNLNAAAALRKLNSL